MKPRQDLPGPLQRLRSARLGLLGRDSVVRIVPESFDQFHVAVTRSAPRESMNPAVIEAAEQFNRHAVGPSP